MVKVSIIMPVYNGERFLQAAIDSALAQTFTDWELIIVDDGSKDSTPQILSHAADSRIQVIRKENGGEASARNAALDIARGEYVSFLDADDLYLPNALADMTDFLDHYPEFEVVFCDGYLCDEHDEKLTRLTEHRPGIYTGDILEPLVLTAGVITVPVCTMLRRSVIEQHHLRFDTQFVIGPDWDFWIQTARVARFGYLDKVTCMYRVHLTNITRTSGSIRRMEDLIHGREKVMRSGWFASLSQTTRHKFFYNLLMTLTSGQPARQLGLIKEPEFQRLSQASQSALARQVGIDILRQSCDLDLALPCFEASLFANPFDRKTQAVMIFTKLGQKPLIGILRAWDVAHKFSVAVRGIGRRKSKPVPAQLRPVKG